MLPTRSLLPQRSVLGALEKTVQLDQLTPVEKRMIVRQFALSAVGAVAGYLVGRKYNHPVLGVLGGLSAGSSTALLTNGLPAEAAQVALVETAAIGLALQWPQHPALGYVGGHIGASLLFDALIQKPMTTTVNGADD